MILSRAPWLSRFFSTGPIILKEITAYHEKLAARKPLPIIPETDLEETFIRGNVLFFSFLIGGSGPGGQKINKTSNCVQLRHIPTGMMIKCQESRSRDENRRIARRILARKLDVLENEENSWDEVKKWKEIRKKKNREKKSRRKYRRLAEEAQAEDKDAEAE